MLFSNVVGQQMAKQGIMKMWHNNVFPHAMLITGAEGTGGLAMALAIAQYVFCENKTPTDSCGKCPGCGKALKLEHADLHLSFPSIPPKPGTKAMSRHYMTEFREFVKQTPYGTTFEWLQHINAENKQGNITAEECREIINNLNLKSYEGGKKVLLMWRPEYLGKEGNILLKLIEEPPKDTIMLFVAEQTEDVLQTILSRTQEVRLAPIQPDAIANALLSRGVADDTTAKQIAHLAMGSYTEALRLSRHTDNDLYPEVRGLFNSLFTNNGANLSKFAEDWAKAGREQQKNFLNYVIQLLEQAIRYRYRPGMPIALPDAEAQFVQKLSVSKISLDGFGQMATTITDTISYIERNANSKIQLHALAIRLLHIVQNRPLSVTV
jgi:DNA polymerase-3 subunit delta'